MKHIRALSLLAVIVASASVAKAQTMAYATVAVTDYGYTINGGGLIVNGDHVGFGFGGVYDFVHGGRLHLGADGRFGVSPSAYGGDKAFVSLRIACVPRRVPLRPYFQFGGGVIQTKLPAQSNIVGAQTFTHAGIDLAAGLDFRITQSVDWRILELESGASGGTSATGSASLSTGIVYHFHPAQHNKA